MHKEGKGVTAIRRALDNKICRTTIYTILGQMREREKAQAGEQAQET